MAQSEDLPIFKASYDLLEQWTDLAKDLPKFFRYSIGQRMVDLCLDLLGNIYRANMKRDKAEPLTDLQICYRQLRAPWYRWMYVGRRGHRCRMVVVTKCFD